MSDTPPDMSAVMFMAEQLSTAPDTFTVHGMARFIIQGRQPGDSRSVTIHTQATGGSLSGIAVREVGLLAVDTAAVADGMAADGGVQAVIVMWTSTLTEILTSIEPKIIYTTEDAILQAEHLRADPASQGRAAAPEQADLRFPDRIRNRQADLLIKIMSLPTVMAMYIAEQTKDGRVVIVAPGQTESLLLHAHRLHEHHPPAQAHPI